MRTVMRSLYVHFPFCESKCHYCDFYSIGREKTKDKDHSNFISSLSCEGALVHSHLDSKLDTIFFGGGTPSMTSPAEMRTALSPLHLSEKIHATTEWTMEANPSSINLEYLREYQNLGVNRISMGVQSLIDSQLKLLGRVHSEKEALLALETIFKSGFENVSTDLLCGVPGQSLKDIEYALKRLTDFPITHLSCYLLTLPKHHALYKELPNEEHQLEHLLFVDDWMKTQGFEHYEISNYAKPNHRALHNLSYWKGHSYLGLGPSAHSFDSDKKTRWKNVSSIHKYRDLLSQKQSPVEWTETLRADQLELEKWMLGLRLNDGFSKDWLKTDSQKMKASRFQESGLLEVHPEDSKRLRLTARGFALSDQVIAALV